MNRCEDYPCCGHTDGLGCNYTPDYDYINKHIGCEHEHGWCYSDDRVTKTRTRTGKRLIPTLIRTRSTL